MQFEAVLASADSKGDAPSRFELRSNPATDEVVFYVSPDPALPQKPRDYSHATRGGNRCATRARPAVDARCPFCPGNEKLCNADLATVTTDGAWTARVFENAFPIFHALDAGAGDRLGTGDRLAACGQMEVLVAARAHNEGLADLSPAAAGELVTLARDRFNVLAARRGARSVRVFQNHGARAGASISHAHWQCVALGFVPPNALRRAAAQARGDACPVRALMDAPETLVWEDANARAFAVVAPRRGTVWVAPRRRRARIGELTDDECRSIGEGLRTVARAMCQAWDDPDFNLVAHSASLQSTERFHAYFEIVPHRREDASLGSLQYDVPISHLPPEQCAAELNSVECYPNPRHWIPTDRSRGPSKSTIITDCHWPSTSAPSTTGIDSELPSSMLPKWECALIGSWSRHRCNSSSSSTFQPFSRHLCRSSSESGRVSMSLCL